MTVLEAYALASRTGTPIGTVPENYAKLAELCRQAHMKFTDEKLDGKLLRTWAVVPDPKTKTCIDFHKFCMLLDLIKHDHKDWTRTSVLDSAITNNSRRSLLNMNWEDMHDQLVEIGVEGYLKLRRKSSKGNSFKAFSDVLDE